MSLKNKKILITCGPTWMPIDDMRVISNRSSGVLGQQIAQELHRHGPQITLLLGPIIRSLHVYKYDRVRVVKFKLYDELADLLKKELKKKYDIVIHAAAVSDYRPKKNFSSKIPSGKPRLCIELVPTKKLIGMIKKLAPESFLVGFKQESSENKNTLVQKAKTLIKKDNCDLVIANSVKSNYTGYIIDKEGTILGPTKSRASMAFELVKTLKQL